MPWRIEYYEELDGRCPVETFLDSLLAEERGKVFQVIRLLEELGPILDYPFSEQIEGKLRALRTQFGKTNLRVLYYGDANRAFVLLHGLRKRSQKLKREDKRIGLNRMAIDVEHKEREDKGRRRHP